MSSNETGTRDTVLPKIIDSWGVSDHTGIPVPTLRNWRYLRKGPRSFKLGRSVRYLESDVLAWVEEQQQADPCWADEIS
jgi:predicted DNA-binding transcriptional regulator AlpA